MHICMFSNVRSERFRNTIKHMGKEDQRKKTKTLKGSIEDRGRMTAHSGLIRPGIPI